MGRRDDTVSHMDNEKSHDSTSPKNADEEQAVFGLKSTNNEPEEKNMSLPAKPESESAHNGAIDSDSPKSAKELQLNNHFMSRKQPNHKNYYDEEDNLSLASSTATSVRNKITVPIAPRFTCVDRLERRKEFYTKLDEKHKALENEKLEYESRTKEEEQAAIKQLRKNMVVKAKPVPSFYREGPPPKVELKKLPVTRAKSPNLTRRKSCGDAIKPSTEDKGLSGRTPRHSVGLYRESRASPGQKKASPITKDAWKLNGSSKKVKNQSKDAPENSQKKASPITKDARKLNGSSKKVKNQSKDAPENSRVQEHGGDDIGVVRVLNSSR